LEQLEREALQVKDQPTTLLFRIWHILYSIPMEQDRVDALKAIKEIPVELVADLAKVRYERKHGAVVRAGCIAHSAPHGLWNGMERGQHA
jgi:hypothetical protein